MKKDEPVQRYVTYDFDVREIEEDVLWYAVRSIRQLPDDQLQVTYHDVCISRKGYLVIAGLTDKETLLKYLANLLHPEGYVFVPKYLSKSEILQITSKILEEDDSNKIHTPRFHFFEKYKGREFSDFYVSEKESAADDPEYPQMLERCQYFEPIFKTQKINGQYFVSDLKLNRRGLIYSSQRMYFEDWIEFIKKHLSWCL